MNLKFFKHKVFLWSTILLCIIISLITKLWPFVLKDDVWIGFTGSILSGLITLVGVIVTIMDIRIRDAREKIPQQLMLLDDLLYFLESQLKLIEKLNEIKDDKVFSESMEERLKWILEGPEDGGSISRFASQINLKTYQIVREFQKEVDLYLELKQLRRSYFYNFEDRYEKYISKLNNEKNSLEFKI